MNPSDYALFYSSATLQAYTADQMLALFGINLQTISIEILNYQSFYPVVETTPTADSGLYVTTPVYTVNGTIADQTWTYTARPLPTAKSWGTSQAVAAANQQVADIVAISTYSAEVLAAAGAALEGDRPAIYQTVIAAEQVVTDQLALDVAAIAAATTVDEINNIVNPPYGDISTSRTGNDFNDSSYVTFYSTSLVEGDTELFIPATSTVIPYILPTQFNAFSEAFGGGNYTVQIRESLTGLVLAEFICPEAPALPTPF
jgi:hypothetical protein